MKNGNAGFTKMTLIKLVFNMIWLMEILKIKQKRIEFFKVLRDKPFEIASNPKYDGYQTGLASVVYSFFDEKSMAVESNLCQISNFQMNFINQLLENSKEEVYFSFKDNIWWWWWWWWWWGWWWWWWGGGGGGWGWQ